MTVIAKSLDVYALVKLLLEKSPRPYGAVASELGMSASEYHAAVHRLGRAGLIDLESRAVRKRPVRDFLFHGLRYVFPAARGGAESWVADFIRRPAFERIDRERR